MDNAAARDSKRLTDEDCAISGRNRSSGRLRKCDPLLQG
jgi:hypothetical protein